MQPLPKPAPTTAERIRSACARAGGALLALENGEARGKTHADAVVAPVHHLLPDPFCEIESSLLWHLDITHNDVVARLVSKLPAPLRRGQVRPLGLDRYGVRFRVECNDGDRDVRLPFHKPVNDMAGLSQAIRVLMGCPFINGLRARR